ncbi:MAG: efflux RND transporter permease subunit, partial [Desulfobacterales bacterium]|nr:efflux RND transporter permease subunit [Desulfobacterales bacterium]
RFALGHRKAVVAAAVLLLVGSLALIPRVGVEFMPESDESEVRVEGEMAVGTKLAVVDQAFQQIEGIVQQSTPEIQNMVTFVGPSSFRSTGGHTGSLRVALKPVSERSRSSEQVAADLRRKLSSIPGVKVRTRAGQGLFILRMGAAGTDKLQVEIRGHDLETSDELARRVKALMEETEGVTDARISRESGSPEELILVDRQKAADMQLTVSQIAKMLQTVLSGTVASQYREGGDEFGILVKLKGAEQQQLQNLLDLPLTNAQGQPVVLRNVVRVEPRSGPVLIQRKDQERVTTVSGNLSGRDLGAVIAEMQQKVRRVPVPRDFSIVFAGDYEEQQQAFTELRLGIVLALILVYMVMAALYESLRDPFVVMFSVPFAAIGVILMLLVTHTTFNVQSYIGCIILGGIVVNNAILLVDHINLLRRRDGMPLTEAIAEAGRRRLRPILMTASTSMLALVPLAIGIGEGGETQAPMARAVVGGLLSSTLITLVVVPTIYSLFERAPAKDLKEFKVLETAVPQP